MNPMRQQMNQLLRDRFRELQAKEPVEVDQSAVPLTPQQWMDLLADLQREVDEALGPISQELPFGGIRIESAPGQ